MKVYLSHSSSFDFQMELYEPLKQRLEAKYEVFYPHDKDNIDTKTKEVIAASDVILAEVSYPSTGQGIELGWADANKVPIVCFYRKDSKTSDSLPFVSEIFVDYENRQEMLGKLEEWLSQHNADKD